MGRAAGVAAQIRSDCGDLFSALHSRDLAAGARTLPLVLHLETLIGAEQEEFIALLERARTEAPAQEAVRGRLRGTGVLNACAVLAELWCQRARDSLARTGARGSATAGLNHFIDDVSFYAAAGTATNHS
jgi:geranylgeranyl pyrophosphate synthase